MARRDPRGSRWSAIILRDSLRESGSGKRVLMSPRKPAKGAQVTTAELLTRLASRTGHVGVVGLGYVGLPLALTFARMGFQVTGFDIDAHKVEKLQRRESYIRHIPASAIAQAVEKWHFQATSDFKQLRGMDVILICVPTPRNEHREPDMSFVRNTAESIRATLRRGQLVVLESTTYPGTTEEIILPILEKSGLRCPAL